MTTQSKRTVAFALCGSFCSFAAVLPQLRVLTARGWDVLPVLSASAAGLDTRFGTASALRQTLYEVTGHRPLTTLQAVEPLGPQRRSYYFVPFGQDDSYKKPCSLKSDFTLLPDTLEAALRGVQIQPLLL